MEWITPRMRISLMVLAATVWGWALTLPRWREVVQHPAIHPSSEWWWLVPVDAVLLIIDAWAVWYWMRDRPEQD